MHLPDPAPPDAAAEPRDEVKLAKQEKQGAPPDSEASTTPSTERPSHVAMMSHPDSSSSPSAGRAEAQSPLNIVSAPEGDTATISRRRPQAGASETESEMITIQTVGSAPASSAMPEAIPIVHSASSRPPILLDAAILVLLILAVALALKKIL